MRGSARIETRLVARPKVEEPLESAQQEMSGPASRVDQPCFAEAELTDCRIERAFEDELLDKLGRLQKRVALTGRL